jgi:hypothetical protein
LIRISNDKAFCNLGAFGERGGRFTPSVF